MIMNRFKSLPIFLNRFKSLNGFINTADVCTKIETLPVYSLAVIVVRAVYVSYHFCIGMHIDSRRPEIYHNLRQFATTRESTTHHNLKGADLWHLNSPLRH